MNKSRILIASLAASFALASAPALADRGGDVALSIIGGLLVGSALSQPSYGYSAPAPNYYPQPSQPYYAPSYPSNYQPAPNYYPQQPAYPSYYSQPAPVYYAPPAPIYYQPAPVYYAPPAPSYYYGQPNVSLNLGYVFGGHRHWH